MANLVTKVPNDNGAYPTLDNLAEVSNTAEFGTGHNTVLLLENTNAATRTVDIVVAGETDYGMAYPDRQYTLAATTGRLMIPLRRRYADPNVPGRVTFTVSAFADVKACVLRVS